MPEKPEQDAKDTEQEQNAGEEPKVYSVKKGLSGWEFGRREFLTATAAAAAAAAAAGAIGKSKQEASQNIKGAGKSITLAVAMPVLMSVNPAQSFAQAWRFTNDSEDTWCKAPTLHLATDNEMEAPTSLPVPDIGPGETVTVEADMVAPAKPGIYHSIGRLKFADITASVDVGPTIVQSQCIIESSHPYQNNLSQTWPLTNPDENAEYTQLHFSRVDLASGDYIILKDGAGEEQQRITGDHPYGLWSKLIPGREVTVHFVTNASGSGWGFCIDQVETRYRVHLPLISKEPTPTPSPVPSPTPKPCLAESGHPYRNDANYTWTVTNPDSGAQGSRVHFSRLEVEEDYDYIIIRDDLNRQYQRITGSYPTGLWSYRVAGREVRIQLVTDGVVTDWGFCVDKVESTTAPPTPTPTATPCSCHGVCTCDGVCSCDDHCDCDPYCTCDTVHYWYPN